MSDAAANANAPATEDGEAKPKKSGKVKLLIIIAVVLVLLIGGLGGFLVMRAKHRTNQLDTGHAAPQQEKHPTGPPVFLPLEGFTVNLAENGDPHYLQLGLTMEITDASVAEAVKAYMPIIRSRILILLTSKSSEQIGSLAGKKQLAREILEITRSHLPEPKEDPEGNKGIRDVHFVSLVIQ